MSKRSSLFKWSLLGVAMVGLIVLGFLLPIREWLEASRSTFEGLGFLGGVLFVLGYALATVLMVPGSVSTIAAGLIFGLAGGFAVALLGASIGSTLAFLIARYVARKPLSARLEKHPKFKAVDAAVEELGYKIVLLLRMSPLVPFNLQNYLFGVTKVGLASFVGASLVGMAPGTFLYVYLGSIGAKAGEGGEGPWKWIFYCVGLIATIVVTVVVSRKAKQALGKAGVAEAKAHSASS